MFAVMLAQPVGLPVVSSLVAALTLASMGLAALISWGVAATSPERKRQIAVAVTVAVVFVLALTQKAEAFYYNGLIWGSFWPW